MSDLYFAGRALVQQLNCAKGLACTILAVQDLDSSPNVFAFLLNELWISNTGLPTVSTNFEMFYPTVSPKCITYLRKDLNHHPTIVSSYDISIISIQIHTHLRPAELLNVYASKTDMFIQLATTHSSLSKCAIMSDFNEHSA